MGFKFEKLEVWQLAVEYVDYIYSVAEGLPKSEDFNLKSQIIRAATSVALNIAEGSATQSGAEQSRFVGISIHSLVETVACLHLIRRRGYLGSETLDEVYVLSEKLFAKLQAFQNSLKSDRLVSSGGGRNE